MADYSTIEEVESLLPNGQNLSNQTDQEPSRATVIAWIPKITAQIDAAMAEQGETVPLTGNKATVAGLMGSKELAYMVMTLRGLKKEVTDGDTTLLDYHQEYLAYIGSTDQAAAAVTGTLMPFGYPDSSVAPVFTRSQARNW